MRACDQCESAPCACPQEELERAGKYEVIDDPVEAPEPNTEIVAGKPSRFPRSCRSCRGMGSHPAYALSPARDCADCGGTGRARG